MSPIQILLVEDEGLIAEDIRNRLTGIGYAVAAVARTGKEAVRAAVRNHPDLVLMDILLKGDMDGIEAATLIRRRLDIPVVYMTAHSDRITLDRVKKTEPHGFLLKPLRDEEIHSVVDMALFRHGMERRLRDSEQRFRTVADFTHDWEYWIDPQNRFVYVSPSCERITGYSAEAFMKQPDLLKEIVHPDDRKPFFKHLGACSKSAGNKAVQFRIITRQGATRWIGHVCRPVYDEDGKGLGTRVNNRDVTDQKEAENRIMKLNRTLTMMSRINEAVAVVRDRGKLFDRACRIALRDGKFALAWIGVVDEKTGTVKPAASAGKAREYVDGLVVSARATVEGRGPTGRAVRDGKPVVCGDLSKEKAMQPWRDRALQYGLRSSAAFPFTIGDRVIGALNLYSSEPDYFDEEEIRLFEELTGSLTFALEHMEEEKRQRELEEKTRYLASFPEQEPNPIMEADLSGRVRYVNPALRRLLPEIETAGLRHPWFSGWRAILGSFKKGEKTQAAHEVEVHGSHYRQLFHFFPKHGMVRILALDVTERRIAEAALRESEERYRAVIETTDTGYVVLDEKGRVLDANRNYVGLTGHSTLDEIRGRSVTDWTAPHDRARNQAEVARCLKKGSVRNLEIDYRRADGASIPVEINASVIRTKAGRMIVTLCRDISERKRAEAEIRLKAELLDNSTDSIFLHDTDGNLIYVNEKACKALGYTRDELLGINLHQLDTPEYAKQIESRIAGLMKTGEMKFESAHLRRDGSIQPVDVKVRLVRMNEKNLVLSACADITERKRGE
jgi:PAS domain S-box-containing protein